MFQMLDITSAQLPCLALKQLPQSRLEYKTIQSSKYSDHLKRFLQFLETFSLASYVFASWNILIYQPVLSRFRGMITSTVYS